MPLRRVMDLWRYWEEVPPPAEVSAIQLGLSTPTPTEHGPQEPMSEEEARAMVAQINGE